MVQLAVKRVDQAIDETAKVGESGSGSAGTDVKKMYFQPEGKRRKKEPPVYNKRRGDKATALAIAGDPQLRLQAMEAYEKDMRSEGDTSQWNFKTWSQIHIAWWAFESSEQVDVLPITSGKIAAVGASLKAAGYRSASNYMTAAKDRHLELGYNWSEVLDRAAKLFNASCSRGMGPARQSEPLPFAEAARLPWDAAPFVDGGTCQHQGGIGVVHVLPCAGE